MAASPSASPRPLFDPASASVPESEAASLRRHAADDKAVPAGTPPKPPSSRPTEAQDPASPPAGDKRFDMLEILLPAATSDRNSSAGDTSPPPQDTSAAHRHPAWGEAEEPDMQAAPEWTTSVRPAQAYRPAAPRQRHDTRTGLPEPAAPEVHIHIGRVELTALQATQTGSTPRAAAAGKKPMTLDEYLRLRNGRRN